MLLLVATALSPVLPLGSVQTGATLAVAAAMLVAIGLGFVGLHRAPVLVRLTVLAAAFFIALLALISFADLMTRLGPA